MANQPFKARGIALGGVMLALSMAMLFIGTIIPSLDLSAFALSSFFTAFIIIELGIKGGWMFYLASVLLSFIIVPNKLTLILFVMFFAIYGILKYYIEKLQKLPLEIVLKLIAFNLLCGGALWIFKELMLGELEVVTFPLWMVILIAEIAFILYDYVFSAVIVFYLQRIHGKLTRP